MKVTIAMIPEEGRTVQIAHSEAWVRAMIKEALPHEVPDIGSIVGSVHISVLDENITIEGEVGLKIQAPCDRCLEPFITEIEVPIHMDMSPLYRSHRERDEARFRGEDVELTTEDVEFSFYEGADFDLKEIIREQITLALPPQFICSPSCKGLCPRCAFNLNIGPCSCPPIPLAPRFSALKDFKLPK
ncbi:MAG: DUF177 domain-containing protein [Deltaproteobacteria bacterium]|nr:DUF177 domain-containing protein [Deltaproteobacteria bacterium]